jgi:hypothetical protein
MAHWIAERQKRALVEIHDPLLIRILISPPKFRVLYPECLRGQIGHSLTVTHQIIGGFPLEHLLQSSPCTLNEPPVIVNIKAFKSFRMEVTMKVSIRIEEIPRSAENVLAFLFHSRDKDFVETV